MEENIMEINECENMFDNNFIYLQNKRIDYWKDDKVRGVGR